MIYLLLFFTLIFFVGCTYNFEFGSSLANFQEDKYHAYLDNKSLTEKEKKRFKRNMWVKIAQGAAPGNLVIRHYCLIDLFKGRASHRRRIGAQLEILGEDIWREGYSYWLFVKPLLIEYQKKFNRYGDFITRMDKKFQETSYLWKDGKLYPAPFGDIRHIPLETDLQSGHPIQEDRELYPLIIRVLPDSIEYFVQKCPLGFNTHIPLKTHTVIVTKDKVYIKKPDGERVPFKWYKGYDKKYKEKGEEFKDTFNWRRIKSLSPRDLWKIYTNSYYKEKNKR